MILILVASAFGVSGYFLGKWQGEKQAAESQPTAITTTTPSTTSKETTDTSGWQTFTSKQYGYSFKYPANWKINKNDSKDATEESEQSVIIGPANQPVNIIDTSDNYIIRIGSWGTKNLCNAIEGGTSTQPGVAIDKCPGFTSESIKKKLDNYADSYSELTLKSDTAGADIPAFLISGKFTSDGKGENIKPAGTYDYRSLIFKNDDGTYYEISTSVRSFDSEKQATWGEVVESFQFTK